MQARLVKFGEIEVKGKRYTHDVVIEGGKVRKRKKGPSRQFREKFGHTPLSAEEEIPWGGKRLLVGTGAHGALPVMDEVQAEAKRRGIEAPLCSRTAAGNFDGAVAFQDWGATLFFVGRLAFRRRDSELMKALLYGLFVWFPVESLFSAYFRVWFNVGVDVAVLAVLSLPLIITIRLLDETKA